MVNAADAVVTEVDPVCGMKVLPEKATASVEHAGRTWYFCSQSCKTKFEADPHQYDGSHAGPLVSIGSAPTSSVSPAASGEYTCPMHPEVLSAKPGACPKCGMALEPTQPPSPSEHTEYTCPMHPQIVRDQPGACPICGMALEPRTVTASAANPELVSMTRRLWVGAVLTLPLLAIMISDVLPAHPLQGLLQGGLLGWIELALGNPCGAVGRMAFLRAWLGFDCAPQPEYVHAHCDGHRRCLSLQPGCGRRPRPFSRYLPRCLRKPRPLF